MNRKMICLLLSSCLGLVSCAGNDYKVGRKPDETVLTKDGDKVAPLSSEDDVNWCEKSDDRCPSNVCEQAGRVCCWCGSYCSWDPFGVIQPCFCCPKDHACCSSSKPVWLKSPPTCCPSSSECSSDGRSCLHRKNAIPAEVVTELCDTNNHGLGVVNAKLPSKDRSSIPNTAW